MKITRENYEAFFLDYHEGNLSKSQEGELMDFLVHNPDLKAEFESFELIYLEEDIHTQLENKDFLKKTSDEIQLHGITESQLISYHEGELDEKDRLEVLEAVAGDPELRKAFTLFGLTRLQPDLSVVFPSKSSLKRFTLGTTAFIIRRLAVAAAVVAFLVSFYLLLPEGQKPIEVAQTPPPADVIQQPDETPLEIEPIATPQDTYVPEILPQRTPQPRPTPIQVVAEPALQPVTRATDLNRLAEINPIVRPGIESRKHQPEAIEKRLDFYWFSYASGSNVYEEFEDELPAQSPQTPRVVSLTELAFNGLERRTGIDVKAIEGQLSERSFGIWDLAGLGLAGISQLTGTSLALEKETDENGRITTLGIGERFRLKR